MKLTDAQACVDELMGLGYNAFVTQIKADDWTISVQAPALVDQNAANAFAAKHGATVSSYSVATAIVIE